jgi:hypothetical protein
MLEGRAPAIGEERCHYMLNSINAHYYQQPTALKIVRKAAAGVVKPASMLCLCVW